MKGMGTCIGILSGLLLICSDPQGSSATVLGNTFVPMAQPKHGSPPVALTMLNAPMSFEANQGQADPSVNFIARGSGYTLSLTPTESVMVLQLRGSHRAVNQFPGGR